MKRRALITGASAGLAAGIAPVLAGEFEFVAITHRDSDPEPVLASIRARGAEAVAARVDFLDSWGSVEAALADLVRLHGPFDTLVHAVGPFVVKRFERLTDADYHDMFDGNVRSAVLCARAVLPAMRSSRFGRIVYFGSLGAEQTRPFRGFAFYQAAKSALTAFARTLALEEARNGVTVNVVVPGDVRDKTATRAQAHSRSGRAPRGRPGSFEDVADVVSFLIARERDFLTGATVEVTGGLSEADERNEPLQ